MRRHPFRGMTLVELLVVIVTISVLAALLLPAVQAARESARRTQCQSNLRQIGIALHAYHDAYRHLPVGCFDKRVGSTNPDGKQLAWSATLLPQLEEHAVWQETNFKAAYDGNANARAAAQVITVYLCPSTTRLARGREGSFVSNPTAPGGSGYRAAAIDYGGIYGAAQTSPSANGVFLYERAVTLRQITDGTSHTLAVAEDSGRGWLMNGEWINGENIFDVGGQINRHQDNEIWSDHPGGALALWCDGSVSWLHDGIDITALRAMCTRAKSETYPSTY